MNKTFKTQCNKVLKLWGERRQAFIKEGCPVQATVGRLQVASGQESNPEGIELEKKKRETSNMNCMPTIFQELCQAVFFLMLVSLQSCEAYLQIHVSQVRKLEFGYCYQVLCWVSNILKYSLYCTTSFLDLFSYFAFRELHQIQHD